MRNMLIAFLVAFVAFVAAVPATMTAGQQQQQEEQQEEPRRQSLVPGRAAFAAEPEPCDVGLTLLQAPVLEGNFEPDNNGDGGTVQAIYTDWAANYELAEGYTVQWTYSVEYRSVTRSRDLYFSRPDPEEPGVIQWFMENGIVPVYVSPGGLGVYPYEEGMRLVADARSRDEYEPTYSWTGGGNQWSTSDGGDNRHEYIAIETEDGTRYTDRIIDRFYPPEDSYVPERLKREWREQQWPVAWTEWWENSYTQTRGPFTLEVDADHLRYNPQPEPIADGTFAGRGSFHGGYHRVLGFQSYGNGFIPDVDFLERDSWFQNERVSLEVLDIVLHGDVLCQRKGATFIPPPDGP